MISIVVEAIEGVSFTNLENDNDRALNGELVRIFIIVLNGKFPCLEWIL